MAHESVAGEDRQRRPRHQQRRRGIDQCIGLIHHLFGNRLAEVDDVRLEHSATHRAIDELEGVGIRHDGVGVGSHGQAADALRTLGESGVGGLKSVS